MTKIRDIIQINSGYTTYVDLFVDYNDETKNRGRMQRYKPISAHRQVFERISNSLNPTDRRFYFLSGSYGTGKSHLLLMLANYFANPSDLPEMKAFFDNYEAAQKQVLLRPAEQLHEKSARALSDARKTGKYLVAICRFNLNLDFEGTLLHALKDAIQRDASDLEINSYYLEAVRKITSWRERRTEDRFYAELESFLADDKNEYTVDDLEQGLFSYKNESLQVFTDAHRKITDSDFTFAKDNLQDIITDFLKAENFRESYKGIVFLFDEFGSAIDDGLVRYQTLLGFTQYCAASTLEKGGAVIFIGTGHKAFRSHGTPGSYNAETLEARVNEIGLQAQGMEDIIGAVVQPLSDTDAWKNEVLPRSAKFTYFSGVCSRLGIFSWLKAPVLNQNIIQNIFPMHPLATFALIKLASEAGSDNRSVIRFFSPEFETGEEGWQNVQPYSYPWFIENNEITTYDKFNLYTPDLLVDYFGDSLTIDNQRLSQSVKTSVQNYQATIKALSVDLTRRGDGQLFEEIDPWMIRIIKTILINEIISTPELPILNNNENIYFALDVVSQPEKTLIDSKLHFLSNAGIIYNNKKVYELTRNDRKDVRGMLDAYKSNPDHRPDNLLESFLGNVPKASGDQYLEAKEYNDEFSEDKRLKIIFATPYMLSESSIIDGAQHSFFSKLELERKKEKNTAGYEGVAVYVFCETEKDISDAKLAVLINDQPRVLVSIPKSPVSVSDALFTLKGLSDPSFAQQAVDFGNAENEETRKIKSETLLQLTALRQLYESNANVNWFGSKGKQIILNRPLAREAANQLMKVLFLDHRTNFAHNDFNKSHLNLAGTSRSTLIEAGNILLDQSSPIQINWSWPENRGGIKYLRNCFVNHQLLRVTTSDGDIRKLDPEKDITKFKSIVPIYSLLLKQMKELEGKVEVNLNAFLAPYFEQYGMGEIAITLLFLLARRYYGDSLRIKKEPGILSDINLTKTEEVIDLIQGKVPTCVLIFEPVTQQDRAYFALLSQIFNNAPAIAGTEYTITDAFTAITSWWLSLPNIARSIHGSDKTSNAISELLSQYHSKDPYEFIKRDLITIFGYSYRQVFSDQDLSTMDALLRTYKATIESIREQVEEKILVGVAEVFTAASPLDVDIQEAMRSWHTSLTLNQKDHTGYTFHNNDSMPLVKYVSYTNIRDLLFVKLPDSYSLGQITEWSSDHTLRYLDKIRSGKAHIETKAPKVPKIIFEFPPDNILKGTNLSYKTETIIRAVTENGAGVIYYTMDGSDPGNPANNLRLRLEPGQAIEVMGTKQIKFIVDDGDGNVGNPEMILAIDQLEKHKIKVPAQPSLTDQSITFILPTNLESGKITLSSLIDLLLNTKLFSPEELEKFLQGHIYNQKQ